MAQREQTGRIFMQRRPRADPSASAAYRASEHDVLLPMLDAGSPADLSRRRWVEGRPHGDVGSDV